MWKEISEPWKICFEEAWEAYCNGSVPIGAVIVSSEGNVISRGRNMIKERIDKNRKISNSRLAHAEVNAIYSCEEDLRGTSIYSTMEPCVMCFGAIAMNRINEISYAARDGVAGGTNLDNNFIRRKNIKINDYHPFLEIVQLVIKTDYIYRNYPLDDAKRLLSIWEQSCPQGIKLGNLWYQEDKLLKFKQNKDSIGSIVEEISRYIIKEFNVN